MKTNTTTPAATGSPVFFSPRGVGRWTISGLGLIDELAARVENDNARTSLSALAAAR